MAPLGLAWPGKVGEKGEEHLYDWQMPKQNNFAKTILHPQSDAACHRLWGSAL